MAHGHSHGLLMLQENGSQMPAIIKAFQRNPVSHVVDAVDFLRVSLNEQVTSSVPIVLTGEQADVKAGDGVLVQSLMELQIVSLPQNMPESITVDISNLVLNGAPIHVGELTLPEGVEAVTDAGESVAVVNPAEREEAEEPTTPLGEEATAEAADTVPAEEG
jgi:large subunit ribosomal protein L25